MAPARVWLNVGRGTASHFLKHPNAEHDALSRSKANLVLVASILGRIGRVQIQIRVLATHSGEVASYSGPQAYG